MITESEVISIGTLRRPHGKQGEIQCQMLNEYWDDAEADFIILRINNILVPFRVTNWRGKGADTLIFQLSGIDSEEEASRLCGTEAYMLRRDMTEEEDTQLTWQQLVGYQVIDTDQGNLGEVMDVDESTINTLITLADERMIPIHEDFIVSIDESEKILTITLPFTL